jgi:nucleoside-diphosphate-sugar epimerase
VSRWFVTGATGFVGGRLALRLCAAGHDVVTVARDPARAHDLAAAGVEVHRGDITDRASLTAPMKGADGVFHLAAWYKVGARDLRPAHPINVGGTRNVLETMRALGIAKGVYTSTLAVFGDTRGRLVDESYYDAGPFLTEYDRTKWLAHYEVAVPMQKAGLPLVIVQPGLVYGPGDTSAVGVTLRQYLKRRLPATPRGSAYCWAHVDDVAHAHVLAMERGRAGDSYIVAGPPHTLIEALALAEQITDVRAPAMHPSPGTLRALATVMGWVGRVVPVPESYSREGLLVAAGVTYLGDHAKARRELGYVPRPLAEGLRETLAHEMRALGMKPPAGT